MQVSDMIKLMKQHMAAGYVNAEKVHIKGIETELKLDISPTVYAYGNLTYQDVRDVLNYLPGTQAPNPTKGLRLPNIPYLLRSSSTSGNLPNYRNDVFPAVSSMTWGYC